MKMNERERQREREQQLQYINRDGKYMKRYSDENIYNNEIKEKIK